MQVKQNLLTLIKSKMNERGFIYVWFGGMHKQKLKINKHIYIVKMWNFHTQKIIQVMIKPQLVLYNII